MSKSTLSSLPVVPFFLGVCVTMLFMLMLLSATPSNLRGGDGGVAVTRVYEQVPPITYSWDPTQEVGHEAAEVEVLTTEWEPFIQGGEDPVVVIDDVEFDPDACELQMEFEWSDVDPSACTDAFCPGGEHGELTVDLGWIGDGPIVVEVEDPMYDDAGAILEGGETFFYEWDDVGGDADVTGMFTYVQEDHSLLAYLYSAGSLIGRYLVPLPVHEIQCPISDLGVVVTEEPEVTGTMGDHQITFAFADESGQGLPYELGAHLMEDDCAFLPAEDTADVSVEEFPGETVITYGWLDPMIVTLRYVGSVLQIALTSGVETEVYSVTVPGCPR